MTAARFFYLAGGCFLLASLAAFAGRGVLTMVLEVPGTLYLLGGVISFAYFRWRQRHPS
jgi:hypothetical protein